MRNCNRDSKISKGIEDSKDTINRPCQTRSMESVVTLTLHYTTAIPSIRLQDLTASQPHGACWFSLPRDLGQSCPRKLVCTSFPAPEKAFPLLAKNSSSIYKHVVTLPSVVTGLFLLRSYSPHSVLELFRPTFLLTPRTTSMSTLEGAPIGKGVAQESRIKGGRCEC
jgi:hypothetical protein